MGCVFSCNSSKEYEKRKNIMNRSIYLLKFLLGRHCVKVLHALFQLQCVTKEHIKEHINSKNHFFIVVFYLSQVLKCLFLSVLKDIKILIAFSCSICFENLYPTYTTNNFSFYVLFWVDVWHQNLKWLWTTNNNISCFETLRSWRNKWWRLARGQKRKHNHHYHKKTIMNQLPIKMQWGMDDQWI